MSSSRTRREFLTHAGAAALAAGLPARKLLAALGDPEPARPKVVIARDPALEQGKPDEHRDRLRKMLDASVQRLTGARDPAAAWRTLFKPTDRIGLKVNTLGFTTPPAVADTVASCLIAAGVAADNIVILDRTDKELTRCGFKLNAAGPGVRCVGTDGGLGYGEPESYGKSRSRFSRILTEQCDAIISLPVLKDHGIAGVSLSMKNFYGVIDNPGDLHGGRCDPHIADLVAHPAIAKRWRLSICSGISARYHGGPGNNPAFGWPFAGLLMATDFVALDAVGAELIEAQRKEKQMKPLAEENRPPRYIETAVARGLGVGDLSRIERVEL